MKNIEILYDVLKASPSFTDNEGNLLKNAIQEAALKMNPELLGLLIKNPETKSMFFSEVDEFLVFDKECFNWVIDSKDFLPSSYTGFKNKIMLTDEKGNSLKNNNDVVLSFPCKDCLLEMDSTKETDDRQEIFFNEVLMKKEIDTLLAPKVMTSVKRYDESGVQETTTLSDKDNLIIKGNNLLAMHSLLPRYKGQIKLMYWDILYNTENDNVPYADSFKHSSWLTMMKNRLEVAQKLLKENGAICIHCDINEMAHLKVLCDEIFDRNNFISIITCKVKAPSGVASGAQAIFDCSEYILIYAKDKNVFTYNHVSEDAEIVNEYSKTKDFYKYILHSVDFSKKEYIAEVDGEKIYRIAPEYFHITTMKSQTALDYYTNYESIFRTAALSGGKEKKVKAYLDTIPDANDYLYVYEHTPSKGKHSGQLCQDLIYKKGGLLMLKDFVKVSHKNKQVIKTQHITSIFANDWWQGIASEGNSTLKNGKKPEILIKTLLEMFTDENDFVLDAYLGSGTTAAVAHKIGRQYIGIEQLDSHLDMAVKRLQGVIAGEQSGISKSVNWQGGGNFVYCELAKNSQNMIDKISSVPEIDLSALYDEIKASDFICYRVDIDAMDKEKNGFEKLSEIEKRQFLISIIDKNTLYINYADMDDSDYSIDADTKKFNKNFYKEEK